MKSFTKYLLLLMVFVTSSAMIAQTSVGSLTEEQKIAMDNENMLTEPVGAPFEAGMNRSSVLEIGTGTGYGAYPSYYGDWANYWENCHTQTLYLASELGGPMLITDLQYSFERIAAAPDNYLMNAEIRIFETTDNSLTAGAFYDASGATLVWSSANYVPTTATGWAPVIDITDYVYNGGTNIIVDILWGDNGYYESPYYRTHRTDGGVNRMLVGYADSETPPNYDGVSSNYSNIRFYWDPLTAPGDVDGYALNSDGLAISGVTIGIDGYPTTTTDATGYYSLTGMPSGEQEMTAYKEGYNVITDLVNIPSGGTIAHDFIMTQPSLTINPLFFDETLNPNEYLTTYLGLLNTGSGPGDWTAEIVYTSKSAANGATNVTGQAYPEYTGSTNASSSLTSKEGGMPLEPSDATRDLFECNPDAVFGNSPVGSSNASWSQYGGTYQMYQQINGVSGSWSTVTYWGVFLSGVPTVEDHFIGVYEDLGSTYGNEIASFVLPLEPIATGEVLLGSYPIYQYMAVIDNQDATDFWISCQATSQMYWCWSPSGSGASTTGGDPLAVCIDAGGFGGWLSLSEYEGTVPGMGGTQNVGVNFDATGAEVGEVYTADIILSTDPNVGTFTIPCTMTIFGDPLTPVTDLTVELINDVTGQVDLDWMFTADLTFQYFKIKRNGITVGTTTDLFYTDILPDFGNYCYTVTPVFDEGDGVPAGPECIEWYIPALCWTPATMYNEQWPDVQENVILTLENCGDGTLSFVFPNYVSGSRFACDMEIALYDSFGDGWNGGALDVFVNGNMVLSGITLASGSGPEYWSFPVEGGDNISTVYTAGSWSYENSYEFYDGDGNFIAGFGNVSLPEGTVFGTCPQPSYIVDVQPAMGQIASGSTLDVMLTYDSEGFPAGLYDEWLNIETNDPLRLQDSIFNQMLVYIPGQFYGTVTDCNSGVGMESVTVTAMGTLGEDYTATTNAAGYYEMYVDEDTYDLSFELLGFETSMATGIFAPTGVPVEVSTTMCETPYPVNWVIAQPNDLDTECDVWWTLPMGPYEIIYDDGEADDFVIWTQPGGAVGVHFTPAGYPATVIGGRLNVGDGSFPAGAMFLGTDMAIGVMDDDGVNGLPGTVLDSTIVTVNNYGWVDFYDYFHTTITEGDFYIVMWQLGFAQSSAPVAVDTDLPTVYRSVAMMPGTGTWAMSPYQDFMIRAYVSGPNAGVMASSASTGAKVVLPKVTEGPFLATSMPKGINGTVKDGEFVPVKGVQFNNSRNLMHYRVARISDFDPNVGPQSGVHTVIATPQDEDYLDMAFGGLAEGFYAYGVKAIYESGESVWVYSNTVAHGLDNEVTVNISLCDGNSPEGTEVTLMGLEYPYHTLFELADVDGVAVFDSVIDGLYDLYAFKVGYNLYEHPSLPIFNDLSYNIVLTEIAYEPRNLFVEPLTSHATWDEPLITELYNQDFEDATFPPEGWQASTLGVGWIRSDDGGSGWAIPAGDGFYAVANDDAAGSVSDGSEDYLITPELDLRESADFMLYFSSFYDAAYGQSAYIEYSYDAGATWEVLATMSPGGNWTDVEVDLAMLSGDDAPPVWIAFHSDDNGAWASGWAIDNVIVRNGPSPILGYYVYLNGAFVTQTDIDVREWTYYDLIYGETYTASVRALYACGLSDPAEYTWTSTYLHPPRNISDEYVYNTNEVPVMWNPPMTGTIPMAAAFNVVYVGPQLKSVGPNVDAASEITIIEFEEAVSSRDMGDLQFTFPNADASGEAGCESDGEFFYTVLWNGSNYFKYDLEGNLLETFSIPGTSSVRDLAFDGELMYGAAANTTVYVMDFATQTLITQFTAPTAVRAIAYNEDEQVFYGNNWGTDIVTFDASGANLGSFTPSVTSIYGLAYDKWTDGNQYLWAYDQGANDATQFSLPDGTPTGLTIDVAGIIGSTEMAGGLFTQPALYADDKVTLGGNAQNAIAWGIELADYSGGGGPTPGVVPDGLVSFNLYRDGVNIANVPYEGQGVDEWVTYVDNNLAPACYLYDVSAVYDLTIFGFPGELGESAWNGTDEVCVVWGFELPFFEGWDNGSFEFQSWSFNDQSENWVINSDIGNPEPSAEFTWDPLLEMDYTSTLESNPLNADMLTEGEIYLDFDLSLNDRNSTGMEMMLVEVWNGSSWNQVASFANDGSFDFTASHINITSYAMSRVFSVRFNAVGQNSFDIISWYVDNISIYRECMAPTDLTGEEVWDGGLQQDVAHICWESYVEPSVSQWFYYDDESVEYVWGSTGDWDADVAIKVDASDLVDFAGAAVTKYRAFIDSRLMGVGTVAVKVMQGDNPDPSAPIYEEDVTDQFVAGDDWNDITLGQAVAIDNNQALWIGMYFSGPADTYGPGITTDMGTYDANGDLYYESGAWTNLVTQGINNRAWLIRGFVTTSYGATVALGNNNYTPLPEMTGLSTAGTLASNNATLTDIVDNTSRILDGFNVYRKADMGDYELVATVPAEPNVGSYCYDDADYGTLGCYDYQVTALYLSETDACESAPAMAYELPMNDFVNVCVTGLEDPNAELITKVYPNPAQDAVTVTSSLPMTQLTVTNYVGQVVYTNEMNDATSIKLNTSAYQAGVYLVKIDTENGIVTKRVIITR